MMHYRNTCNSRAFRAYITANCIALFLAPCFTVQTAQASSLGRLFFTPEERVQLEDARARSTAIEEGSTSVLAVNGIVQKHGGGRTVWINGVAQDAGNSDDRSPDALPVAMPGRSRPVKVKVGQRLLLNHPVPQNLPASGK